MDTRLCSAGRLDLDAPIATYLPGYKGPAGPKVTIQQLLNHTSGIENFDKGLDEYGFGQWVAELDAGGRKHRFARPPGRIMGANTLLLQLLDDDVTIMILANTNLVDTDELGFAIARQVLNPEASRPQAKPMRSSAGTS